MSTNSPVPAATGAARRRDAPRENLDRWLGAVQSGAPNALAALYDDAATFLPTLSAQNKHGRAGAEAYFAKFQKAHNGGEVLEESVQWLGEDAYVHSGLYDFRRADGKRIPARFTFVWGRSGGGWRILHHHSSLKPGAT